jgi:hypothetical protein
LGSRAILPFQCGFIIFKGPTYSYLLLLYLDKGKMERVKEIAPSSLLASLIALPKVATSVTALSGRCLSGNTTGNKLATEWQHYGQADFGPWDRTGKLKAEILKG